MIDVHSHLMPGVDDGARSLEEALEAVRLFREAGVTRLATTPHLDGSLTERPAALEARLAELDQAWARLCAGVGEAGPALLRGTEVKLDTPYADLGDPRIRLGGTRFVLVEFPFLAVPPRSVEALEAIWAEGWIPVVAHPERYDSGRVPLELAAAWRRAGGYLQVNSGSLLGRYGPAAARLARRLLEKGLVDLLASDYHSRGRILLQECASDLAKAGAEEQADLLLRVNPGRILDDLPPLPVAPLQDPSGFWRRLTGVFR
jgi:protein-tyrosine phosphatase